jgi:hypothetical protein
MATTQFQQKGSYPISNCRGPLKLFTLIILDARAKGIAAMSRMQAERNDNAMVSTE